MVGDLIVDENWMMACSSDLSSQDMLCVYKKKVNLPVFVIHNNLTRNIRLCLRHVELSCLIQTIKLLRNLIFYSSSM
jgi:hypothetical protein